MPTYGDAFSVTSNEELAYMEGLNAASKPTVGERGLSYIPNNADSYANYLDQVATWKREDELRKEGYAREDTTYQRLVSDLLKAGLNPALVLSSASAQTGAAGSYSTSAFKTSNYAESARNSSANSAKVVGSILAALAVVAAAML